MKNAHIYFLNIDISKVVEENEINGIEKNSTGKKHIENMEKEMKRFAKYSFLK